MCLKNSYKIIKKLKKLTSCFSADIIFVVRLGKGKTLYVLQPITPTEGWSEKVTSLKKTSMNELRNLGDKLKGEIGSGVVLIVSAQGDKVNMIAMATDDVIAKGAHAGNLIKAVASIVGGGGGGRPNMAQAGGKNPAGIDELLAKVPEVLEGQIK